MKKAILRTIFFILCLSGSMAQLSAQAIEPNPNDSWKKRLKAGDKLLSEGDFSSATLHYLSVLVEKPKKKNIAFKAGETAFKARRYQDVVMALENIKDETKKYPKARFYYAMGLKGIGNYQDAASEFDAFSDAYRGEDYQEMSDWATREMQGCTLASETKPSESIKVSYLTKMVNSPRKEFAPIPFGTDILYYSSDNKIATKIYRTERTDRTWKEPLEPAIFGAMEKEHFCGGSFTPNKMRFYFSQCDIIDGEYRCEIYVMQRDPGAWSKPKKLPDYINSEGYTAMDPFVTVENGKEIIYFTSDREGSYGGKDIWYATKNYNTDDLNFDIPVNLGETINTPQDEISPFFVGTTRTLYFSSNGHPNIGGFDVYKSKGALTNWTQPEHLEAPINSSSDDAYLVLREDMNSGFISSNRTFGGEKTSTDNDDLFLFSIKEEEVVLEGKIHEDGNSANLIQNVMISIFEVTSDGEYALNSNITPDGYYQFVVQPGKEYQIKTEKKGFETGSFDVNTADFQGQNSINLDLPMENQNIANNSSDNNDVRIDVPGQSDVSISDNGDGDNGGGPPIPGSTISDPGIGIPGGSSTGSEEEAIPGGGNDDRPLPGGGGRAKYKVTDAGTRPERKITKPKEEVTLPGNSGSKPITFDNEGENGDGKIEKPYVKPTQPVKNKQEPKQNEFPNSSNTIGKKHISALTQGQIDDIGIYNGKPYLKVAGGFLEIDNKPIVDNDFPGVEVGIGSHYRIQLAAVSTYKARKFQNVISSGSEIVLETATSREGKEVTRVMVVSFPNFTTAKAALRTLRSKGYNRAFIIRYEDNRRVGRMIRDID
jgi:hypothetical protein